MKHRVGIISFISMLGIFSYESFGCSPINDQVRDTVDEHHILVLSPYKYPYHKIVKASKEHRTLIIDSSSLSEGNLDFFKSVYKNVIALDSYRDDEAVLTAIEEIHKLNPITLIVAPDEYDIIRAANARKRCIIQGQLPESAECFRNKLLMKLTLSSADVRCPNFISISSAVDLIDFGSSQGYPFIVKPTNEAASKNVIKIVSQDTLRAFVSEFSFLEKSILSGLEAEEFISGTMYHVDGIIYQGKIIACWPSAYINNGMLMVQEGKIFGWYLLSPKNGLTNRLNHFAQQCILNLPIPENTVFHLEIFHTELDELIFCEIASRAGGGGIDKDWYHAFGINIFDEHIRLQAGQSPMALVHNMTAPQSIEGSLFFPVSLGTLEDAESACPYDWVREYALNFQVGAELSKPTVMTDTLSRIRFTANNEDEFLERVGILEEWFKISTKISK